MHLVIYTYHVPLTGGVMDAYEVVFHPDFIAEFRALENEVKEGLGEVFDLLRDKGHTLGRPNVDTLNGSKFKNRMPSSFAVATRVACLATSFIGR
jgi:hypothetical protein